MYFALNGMKIAYFFYMLLFINFDQSIYFSNTYSDLTVIDRVVKNARDFLTDQKILNCMNFLLVLRELLINSVTYNNNHDPDKHLLCKVSRDEGINFKIELKDDYSNIGSKLSDYCFKDTIITPEKKGSMLISMLSENIEFNEDKQKLTVLVKQDGKK